MMYNRVFFTTLLFTTFSMQIQISYSAKEEERKKKRERKNERKKERKGKKEKIKEQRKEFAPQHETP